MRLYSKVRKVEALYRALEKDMQHFKQQTGMGCPAGCGRCCFKADIEATVLEFLPLAYHLFKQGNAMAYWQTLKAQGQGPYCPLLKTKIGIQDKGHCSQYNHRALICRIFGFGAGVNKMDKGYLITCNRLKEEQAAQVAKAQAFIEQGGSKVPYARKYYTRLQGIDLELSQKRYPMHQAIVLALEEVLGYYAYRRHPKNAA